MYNCGSTQMTNNNEKTIDKEKFRIIYDKVDNLTCLAKGPS